MTYCRLLTRLKVKRWVKPSLLGYVVTSCCLMSLLTSFSLCRSEEHTSELQSRPHLVCRLLLEKKNSHYMAYYPYDPDSPARLSSDPTPSLVSIPFRCYWPFVCLTVF